MHSLRFPFVCVVFTAWLAAPNTAQLSGSIYTSTGSGLPEDTGVYDLERQVYLNGGPEPDSPCSGLGLPDGRYYFQVTDPAGMVLLSSDPVTDRELIVSGGVIAGTTGRHARGLARCGAASIALAPFTSLPGPRREYKVWLTPVGSYDWTGGGFFGFAAQHSKSTTFAVVHPQTGVGQSTIFGSVFYDYSEDGQWSPGVPEEVPLAGWRIELYRDGTPDGVTFTDADGRYEFVRELDGTRYKIQEIAPELGYISKVDARWLATTPTAKTVLTSTNRVPGPDFGNLYFEPLIGAAFSKGYWSNKGGEKLLEACDPIWRGALNGAPQAPNCLRDNDGSIYTVPTDVGFDEAVDSWQGFSKGKPALGLAAHMLSAHLAPAILNHSCGPLQGTLFVDQLQDGVLVDFDVMVAGATALLCDPNAADTGPNSPYPELRDAMINCWKEFESINDTGTLANEQVVNRPSKEPDSFQSPY